LRLLERLGVGVAREQQQGERVDQSERRELQSQHSGGVEVFGGQRALELHW
jgi:hypothetical protein